jgi:transposase
MDEMVTISLSEYEGLKREIVELRAVIQGLENTIALMQGGRDSRTSSTSPSHDLGRSNRNNLRVSSGKKPGGQPGHFGHSFQMSDTPDEIIDHVPFVCEKCDEPLHDVSGAFYTRRQIFDLPSVRYVCTEHRSHEKLCPLCGFKNKGGFPEGLRAPIQYGPVVEATTGYMSVYQYIPYRRIIQFFKDCFKLPLSEGSIDNFLESLSVKATPAYETIHERIQSVDVVGSDDTGCRVNGKKHWFHVWQSRFLTFIVSFAHRSHEVIEKNFKDGFLHSVYVSDCYASQLKTTAKAHQLCIAHLLRELLNFEKSLRSEWSAKMKELLYRAWNLKRSMTCDDYRSPPPQVALLNTQLDELLAVDYSKFHKKEQAFIKRLNKHRQSIFTFLTCLEVPPDNNGSERAIRNVKVKTKVSGHFRNKDGKGAERYAKIRSVIDTTIKNGQDVYQALMCMANCRIQAHT